MKKVLAIAAFAIFATVLVGCSDDDNPVAPDAVPATPQGVFSVTGDGQVYVLFNGIYERDVDYYRVYRSFDPVDNYVAIGTVDADPNPNLDLYLYQYVDNTVTNGQTYYYAVTAVDNAGQESALSAENVFDTPRPEGSVILVANDVLAGGAGSGFNFALRATIPDTSSITDIFIDRFDGVMYVNAGRDITDLQDMGYTSNFDDIGWAPTEGWSTLGYAELILGHTYVIWTADENFAKIRVVAMNVTSGSVELRWAYQTVVGNPELSIPNLGKPIPADVAPRNRENSVQR
ncbi:hypothetical protein KQH51_01675 [bacterium]|nr:hypothetical protein [bacterium]MCB2201634.1 hypothetical protein [bacterium]